MTKRRFNLWVGLVLSLAATYYAPITVMFFFFMSNGADPLSAAFSGPSALVGLAATILCLAWFIYCLTALIKGEE
jgi:hypothetical protein